MAVFGAPIAHEDHARRACYAALRMLDDVSEYAAELRRAEGLNFSVRVGVNSGEVVAGAIGAGSSIGDYTAIGHTVGLAQRMEALAEPGKAYLTEATRRAGAAASSSSRTSASSRSRARAGRCGSSSWPESARHARGSTSRASAASPASSAAAGDGDLRGGASSAPIGPSGAVVAGRSPNPASARAASASNSPSAAARDGVEVFEAQAQSHGKSIPFMPVLQMLRAYFGIGDREPERIAREKIAGRALLLDPRARRRACRCSSTSSASRTPTARFRR